MLWKCCTQYASKFRKLSSGHRTGKGQLSLQSQRKAMPKNAQTTAQLHSSHMLVMLKILQARLQQYVNCELPDVQAGFRKGRGTRDQIANTHWIIKKNKRVPEKHLLLLYWLCQTVWITTNCGKFFKRMGIPDHRTCLLRNLYAGQEQLELGMEQQIGSKSGKEYIKAASYHPAYLTYMQSTSCKC